MVIETMRNHRQQDTNENSELASIVLIKKTHEKAQIVK